MTRVNSYTIGELARAVGVPTSTIRYYERAGLLRPDARTYSNYRQYTAKTLDRLRFIRSAQATGFSLEDIRQLLSLTHADEPPCAEVVTLTKKRLGEIRQRVKELRHVERVLAKSLDDCCKGTGPDMCDEIVRLSGGSVPKCDAKCDPVKKCDCCP